MKTARALVCGMAFCLVTTSICFGQQSLDSHVVAEVRGQKLTVDELEK